MDQESILHAQNPLIFQTTGLFFFLPAGIVPYHSLSVGKKLFRFYQESFPAGTFRKYTKSSLYPCRSCCLWDCEGKNLFWNISCRPPDPGKTCCSSAPLKEDWKAFLRLTAEEQRTADLLSWWLDGQIALNDFYYFQEPLGPTLGIQAQLPILLSEYVFRSEQDVHEYLALLLNSFPDYFSAITAFEQLKKQMLVCCMNAESLEKVIFQCRIFLRRKTIFWACQFWERTRSCHFSPLIRRLPMRSGIRSCSSDVFFLPTSSLPPILVTASAGYCPEEPLGLAHVPNGTSYFRWLLTYETGTNRTVAEIQDLLDDQIASDYETILQAVQNGVDLLHPVSETLLPDTEPEQMLLYLSEEIQKDFPTVLDITWQIKNVPDALTSTLSPAFFLTPPLDIPEENIIYVNPAYEPDEKELVTTLAHEGYPGHLYQNTFESSLPPIRSLFYIGGYTEGWGLYSELYAYDFLGYSTETASALRALSSLNYAICSVLDLEVHTSGWTEEDCSNYLQNFGITDAEQAHSLYLTILEEPANYLKYYLGYLEICKLKESAFALSPDLSLIEFHRWFLEEGPTPFSLLQKDLPDLCHENSLK